MLSIANGGPRRLVAGLTIGGVAVLGLAACGSAKPSSGSGGSGTSSTGTTSTSNLTPTAELAAAESNLGKSNAATLTFKLDTTAAALVKISNDGTAGDAITPAEAAAIVGGSVVVSAKTVSGSLSSQTGTGKSEFAFNLNAGGYPDLFQVVSIGGNLYLRAGVKQILTLAGKPNELATLPLSSLPAADAFIGKAVAGDWLEISTAQLTSLESSLGGTTATASASPSTPSAGQITALEQDLKSVIAKDITVTKGTSDPTLGDELILTGQAQTVATDLVNTLKMAGGSIPGLSSELNKASATSVPAKTVTIDAYVKNGAVDAIKVDLTQFASAADVAKLAGAPLALELDITPSASISAPAGATNVDLTSALGSLGGLSGLLGKSG